MRTGLAIKENKRDFLPPPPFYFCKILTLGRIQNDHWW